MFCRHCGKEIPNEALFCKYCGTPVAVTPAAPAVEQPVYAPAAPVTPEPAAEEPFIPEVEEPTVEDAVFIPPVAEEVPVVEAQPVTPEPQQFTQAPPAAPEVPEQPAFTQAPPVTPVTAAADGFTQAPPVTPEPQPFTQAPSQYTQTPPAAPAPEEPGRIAAGWQAAQGAFKDQMKKKDGGLFTGFFTKPVSTLEKASGQKGVVMGIVPLALYALFTGFFTISLMRGIVAKMYGAMGGMGGYMSKGEFISAAFQESGISRVGMFFRSFFVCLLGTAILLFLMYGIGKAFKSKGSLGGWVNVFGVATIPSLCGLFLGTITGFFGLVYASLFFLLAGSMMTTALYYHGFQIHSKEDRDRMYLAYAVVMAILVLVVCIYMKVAIGSAISQAGGLMNIF